MNLFFIFTIAFAMRTLEIVQISGHCIEVSVEPTDTIADVIQHLEQPRGCTLHLLEQERKLLRETRISELNADTSTLALIAVKSLEYHIRDIWTQVISTNCFLPGIPLDEFRLSHFRILIMNFESEEFGIYKIHPDTSGNYFDTILKISQMQMAVEKNTDAYNILEQLIVYINYCQACEKSVNRTCHSAFSVPVGAAISLNGILMSNHLFCNLGLLAIGCSCVYDITESYYWEIQKGKLKKKIDIGKFMNAFTQQAEKDFFNAPPRQEDMDISHHLKQ